MKIVTRNRCRLKYEGIRTETRFRLSTKRTSPFKSAGASVQSTTGNRGVRVSGINAGYTMFRGSVKSTGYPLHSPVHLNRPVAVSSVDYWQPSCAPSAVVMLDTPCSEVVWRVLATQCIRQFPLHFPSLRHRVLSHFNWSLELVTSAVCRSLVQGNPPHCICVIYWAQVGKINAHLHPQWVCPEGSRKLSFPAFVTTAQNGVKFVSLTHRPPLPPENTPGTHFC